MAEAGAVAAGAGEAAVDEGPVRVDPQLAEGVALGGEALSVGGDPRVADQLYGDPRVAFWTGPWSRKSVEARTQATTVRWATDQAGKWMARDLHDGSLVGRGGFTRLDLDGEDVLELGWVPRDALTGRG